MTEVGKRVLTPAQAERLPLSLRTSLEHPARRRILRILHEEARPLTPSELSDSCCPSCSLSCVTYHLGVLVEAGLVRRAQARNDTGGLEHRFSVTAEAGQAVVDLLQATAAADGLHLQPARA